MFALMLFTVISYFHASQNGRDKTYARTVLSYILRYLKAFQNTMTHEYNNIYMHHTGNHYTCTGLDVRFGARYNFDVNKSHSSKCFTHLLKHGCYLPYVPLQRSILIYAFVSVLSAYCCIIRSRRLVH